MVSTLDIFRWKGGFIYDSDSNKALIAFVGSLALHILIFAYFTLFPHSPNVSKQDDQLEIVFTEPKPPKVIEKSYLDLEQEERVETKKPKEVRFNSNNRVRVEEETVASLQKAPVMADFNSKGRGNSFDKAKGAPSSQSPNNGQRKQTVTKKGEGRQELILPGFGTPSSRPQVPAYVQQQLPSGVRLGSVTAINSDQYRYYSYNQRFSSQFIPLWGANVRQAIYKLLQKGPLPPISKNWITNVEIILNEKGEILDVQPFRLSGYWDMDEAAIEAFKAVKNVPNPPKEMIDENGYIHLQFQTEVFYVPQPGVRFHSDN